MFGRVWFEACFYNWMMSREGRRTPEPPPSFDSQTSLILAQRTGLVLGVTALPHEAGTAECITVRQLLPEPHVFLSPFPSCPLSPLLFPVHFLSLFPFFITSHLLSLTSSSLLMGPSFFLLPKFKIVLTLPPLSILIFSDIKTIPKIAH